MIFRGLALIIAELLFTTCCWASEAGESRFGVESHAVPMCAFTSGAQAAAQSNMSLNGTANELSKITINELNDEITAKLKRASIQLSIRGVCNHAHRISIMTTKGALVSSSQATSTGGAFLNQVGYNAMVTWGNQSIELTTDGTQGKISSSNPIGGANIGVITVAISIDERNNSFDIPVLAGTYTDTLVLHIGSSY
jgi:hypothetical protein